jgi:hypothetical protein
MEPDEGQGRGMVYFWWKVCKLRRLKEEWWAYREPYHRQAGDGLVGKNLKDKCVGTEAKVMVSKIENLKEI